MALLQPLLSIPDDMAAWHMRFSRARLTEDLEGNDVGKYAVVKIQRSPIEQNHIVRVIDEDEQPITGLRVIFGFPGGDGKHIMVGGKDNLWSPPDAPDVLRGNDQFTINGIAQHTTGKEGGEDVWIHNVEPSGSIELASDIVRNCRSIAEANNHTCVMITFQRQDRRVTPKGDRLKALEDRLKTLEDRVSALEEESGGG